MQITDEQIKAALAEHPFPDKPSIVWGNKLFEHIDSSFRLRPADCWIQAADVVGCHVVRRLIEIAQTGEVARTAFRLYLMRIASARWAKRQIERGGGCVTNYGMGPTRDRAVGWRQCSQTLPPYGEAVVVRWPSGRMRIMSREEIPEEPGKHCWCWLPDCPNYDHESDTWASIDAEWEPDCDEDPPTEWSYLPR